MPSLPEVLWTKAVLCVVILALVTEVLALNGPNVCMVQQKYNITKLVKYRAPMSIRTYEWCFSMPPRCSKWNTEMRDLTRLETEERIAEVAVCCPGYKMRDVSCVSICPSGKTGAECTQDCPKNKWGPNCVNECKPCDHGTCSPMTGECQCEDGWQGESCETSMPTTTEDILTTTKTTRITVTTSTKPTTTSIATSTTTEATTSTSNTPLTATSKSTTELSTTQKTATEEFLTPIKIIPNEKVSATTREPFQKQTEQRTTTTGATTIESQIVEQIKRNNEEIVTSNPEVVQGTTSSIDITHTPEINQIVANVTHYILLGDSLINQPNIDDKDATAKGPITDSNLLKKDIRENNMIIKPSTNLNISNRTTVFETTTIIEELITEKPTTIAVENKVNNTGSPQIKASGVKTTEKSAKRELPVFTTTTESTPQTTQKLESTTSIETSTRFSLTTSKFKPKEIWIKPAQKGDSTELKSKNNYDLHNHKSTNKELSINTTPKTIIVSIIPTSVSYATFKKIALTTIAYIPFKFNTTVQNSNKIEQGITKAMSLTTTSSTMEISPVTSLNTTSSLNTKTTSISRSNSTLPLTTITTKAIKTYSMTTNAATSNSLNTSTNNPIKILTSTAQTIDTTKPVKTYHWITNKGTSQTNKSLTSKLDAINKTIDSKVINNISTKAIANSNKSLSNDKITTETPADEETFHILTEPEHITAVMTDKESDRASMDLKSVISIAGGVMMAVITVAVIIVMIERCKRPRYEDVRKINDIRMQVMIDGNDAPPPYVRSIFHTPLPEPPVADKCHYQPISSLDRNLKQFMRPVVVQTISPIMLENFRGILECHYDHLPRRSHDFQPIPVRCSGAPSIECCELTPLRSHSVAGHDIDSMKREAKLDEIDNTTAEPLYAEIPCWRPPSEHAIEILNINGEAVTEL